VTIPLTDWIVIYNPCRAPEIRCTVIVGHLPGGKRVMTSPVAGVHGSHSFETRSGSLYELSGPGHDSPDNRGLDTPGDPLAEVAICCKIQRGEAP
jgi:hypothetical protein